MLQPFQLGVPALDAFPRALWQRIVARQLRGSTVASTALPPAGGLPELREAIAHYLHLSRGISCQPEQIFLCAGYPALLDWVVERCCTPVTQYGLKIPVIRLRARCCGPPA